MTDLVCEVPTDWVSTFSNCLYDWQTIIAGVAAVGVATITIIVLRNQIAQTERLANRSREAKLAVARAKLMVPSSDLARHARACFDELVEMEPAILNQRRVIAAPINIPSLPPPVEIALDAMLEATDDRVAIFAISAVYGEQQVLSARSEDMHESPSAHRLSLDYYFMQPTIMHAIAMKLLGYARYEDNSVAALDWDDMRASIRSLSQDGARTARLEGFALDKRDRRIAIPYAIQEGQ